MKRIIFLIMVVLLALSAKAQVYTSPGSNVSFFSKAPLEDIEAVNRDAQSLIDFGKKDVVVRIPIRSFRFKKALMEEHFNENYMESDKYKFAVFKGKINESIDVNKDGTYNVSATGSLNIHGVEKPRTLKGTLVVKGKNLTLSSNFSVALKDHNIKIPGAVVKNIAEVVSVTTTINYVPKEK